MLQSILKIRMYVISNRIMYLYLLFRLHFMQMLSRTTARSGSHIQGSCEIRSSAPLCFPLHLTHIQSFLCIQQPNQGIAPFFACCLLHCAVAHTLNYFLYIVLDDLGDRTCCCPVITNQPKSKYMETLLAPQTCVVLDLKLFETLTSTRGSVMSW